MTEIKFFFNVDNKLHFACNLAKRAFDDGRKLIVYAPTPKLADEFDRLLWTFSQLSFVPHVKAAHPLAAETPIVIVIAVLVHKSRRTKALHQTIVALAEKGLPVPPELFVDRPANDQTSPLQKGVVLIAVGLGHRSEIYRKD